MMNAETAAYIMMSGGGQPSQRDPAFHALLEEKIFVRTFNLTDDYSYELAAWTTDTNLYKCGEPHAYYGGYNVGVMHPDDYENPDYSYGYLPYFASAFRLMGIVYKNGEPLYALTIRTFYITYNRYTVARRYTSSATRGYISYLYKDRDDVQLDSVTVNSLDRFEPDISYSGFEGRYNVSMILDYTWSYQPYRSTQATDYDIPVISKNGNRVTESNTITFSNGAIINIYPQNTGTLTDLSGAQLFDTVQELQYTISENNGITTVPVRILQPEEE